LNTERANNGQSWDSWATKYSVCYNSRNDTHIHESILTQIKHWVSKWRSNNSFLQNPVNSRENQHATVIPASGKSAIRTPWGEKSK
jgi:hypothetical protein